MINALKRTGVLFLVGAFVGLVASMWWGPMVVSWWYLPGGSGTALVDPARILEAANDLVRTQVIVSITIGVLLAILGNVLAYYRGKARSAAPAPSSTPPAKG